MRLCIGVSLVLLLASSVQAQDRPKEMKAIRRVLHDQAAAWNERDLPRFMKGYWESDQLSFYSGNIKTHGCHARLPWCMAWTSRFISACIAAAGKCTRWP